MDRKPWLAHYFLQIMLMEFYLLMMTCRNVAKSRLYLIVSLLEWNHVARAVLFRIQAVVTHILRAIENHLHLYCEWSEMIPDYGHRLSSSNLHSRSKIHDIRNQYFGEAQMFTLALAQTHIHTHTSPRKTGTNWKKKIVSGNKIYYLSSDIGVM